VSYRAGLGAGMTAIGYEPRDPHIVCDGCGAVASVVGKGHLAHDWFLAGRAPRGWRVLRSYEGANRWDLCPRCQEATR
jgi:ribosomal protein L37E